MHWLRRKFGLEEAGTTVGREVAAGLVTFTTLSYILFVQPVVLAAAGMDMNGVLFATCVASALACFLMAWWANYPFALAPAMGHNFFFSFVVCGTMGFTWQQALAGNLVSGAVFLVLTPTGLREWVLEAIPPAIRSGIAAGIGLLIAMVGFQWGGIIVDHPATYVALAELTEPVPLLTIFGLLLTAGLVVRRVPGAILWGILATAGSGLLATHLFNLEVPLARVHGLFGALPSPEGTAFQLDFEGFFAAGPARWLPVIGVMLFLDLFDSVGSLLSLAGQAGLLKEGRLERARGALAADAAGTVAGACLGTSTVTCYVESAAGVATGGRTGLTSIVVGLCFLLALFLTPLLQTVGAGVEVLPGIMRYPVIAPTLILLGAMMLGALSDVEWDDYSQGIPAFLCAILMPLSFSITDGIAWGFVSYSFLSILKGRPAHAAVHGFALLFLVRYAFGV
jgi:adenine/guanine/hypoxanthine permease